MAFHEWGNICSQSERIPSWGGLCPAPFRLIFVYKYCVRVVLIIHSIHKRFACAPVACDQDEDKDEVEDGRGGKGRRVVNGFCRGATIPAISICDNQIMRSSPRADYQFVPFNFMLINSPRFLLFFCAPFVLTCEKNLTKIYNTNAIIKITTKQLSQQFRLTNQIN